MITIIISNFSPLFLSSDDDDDLLGGGGWIIWDSHEYKDWGMLWKKVLT
jgi:hypothetical protein